MPTPEKRILAKTYFGWKDTLTLLRFENLGRSIARTPVNTKFTEASPTPKHSINLMDLSNNDLGFCRNAMPAIKLPLPAIARRSQVCNTQKMC